MNGTVRSWTADRAWRRALDEQLADELARLRLVLRRHIEWLRHRTGRMPLGGVSPAVVTDDEVLAGLAGGDASAQADFNRSSEHVRAIASLEVVLRERSATMVAGGTPFPVDELAAAFGLGPFVRDTLILALAPELDAAMPRLLAYAQDDASARHATPALATELFGLDAGGRAEDTFGPNGPLERLALVRRTDGLTAAATRPLRLEPRVAWYLRGVDDPTGSAGIGLRRLEPAPIPAELATAAESVATAIARGIDGGRPPVVNLVGPDDRSARALAGSVAGQLGMSLHLVSIDDGADPSDLVATLDRESALRRTGYLLEAGDDNPGYAADIAEGCAALVILASRHPLRIGRPFVTMTVPQAAPASRRVLWAQALGPVGADVEASLREVVHHFDLDPESIARVAAAAQGAARLRGEKVARRDVWQACRVFGRRRLGGLAERINADFGWDDIVLPAAARAQLEEIVAQVRHRATVYEDWQFARRLPRGRGVTALFAGPSGTGKTMAAEVLAHELELDLYRIDLAGVVNKYIGETEKNLRRIFAAAEESGAILFFDEADALFGKRTEISDAHDRYANIETSFLLRRMEDFDGIVVLATNLRENLDEAFTRRLRSIVDFPFPDEAHRREIWARHLPDRAPIGA
ncbi:MAG TPA: ATP-binding protein, partial [Candidatus Limnocylindrales bacterium]|nr:ATP-binding protein [Candidatus Limnocylindrales bacterium]